MSARQGPGETPASFVSVRRNGACLVGYFLHLESSQTLSQRFHTVGVSSFFSFPFQKIATEFHGCLITPVSNPNCKKEQALPKFVCVCWEGEGAAEVDDGCLERTTMLSFPGFPFFWIFHFCVPGLLDGLHSTSRSDSRFRALI